jgi:hypothetical protein
VLDVERWAELRREHFVRGVGIKELVRRTGFSRNTIRAALRSDAPPSFRCGERPSKLEPFKDKARLPRSPGVGLQDDGAWPRGRRRVGPLVDLLRWLDDDPGGPRHRRAGVSCSRGARLAPELRAAGLEAGDDGIDVVAASATCLQVLQARSGTQPETSTACPGCGRPGSALETWAARRPSRRRHG